MVRQSIGITDAGVNAQVMPAGWPCRIARSKYKAIQAVSVTGTVTAARLSRGRLRNGDCAGAEADREVLDLCGERINSLLAAIRAGYVNGVSSRRTRSGRAYCGGETNARRAGGSRYRNGTAHAGWSADHRASKRYRPGESIEGLRLDGRVPEPASFITTLPTAVEVKLKSTVFNCRFAVERVAPSAVPMIWNVVAATGVVPAVVLTVTIEGVPGVTAGGTALQVIPAARFAQPTVMAG